MKIDNYFKIDHTDNINKGGVYLIFFKNNPNKYYVGSTFSTKTASFRIRWVAHFRDLNRNSHYNYKLQKEYNKCPTDIRFQILEYIDNDYVRSFEQWWINMLDSVKNGYNISYNAYYCGNNLTKGKNKRKIYQCTVKGDILRSFNSVTEAAQILKISSNTIFKILSKKNISKTWHNTTFYYENDTILPIKIQKKEVYQYTLGGEFIQKWEKAYCASKYLNIHKEAILQCCRGKSKYAGDYYWSYNYNELLNINIKKVTKKVRCLEDDKVFDSITECKNYYNTTHYKIISACIKNIKLNNKTFELC
jgi:hypothetical protein